MAPNNAPYRRESRARRFVNRLRDRSEISPFYKYVLFFTNFIFLLAGIAMTVVGTYVLVLKEKTVTYFVEFLFDPSCLMCLAGSVTVLAAFLGCGGALRENMTFLRIYYWLLSILLLFQIIIIIFAFIFYFMEDVAQKLNIYPEKLLRDAIIKYREDVDMRNFIDDMQEFLDCCGVSNDEEGFRDWNENKYFNCTGIKNPIGEQCSVPYSCCVKQAGSNINYQCGYNTLNAELTQLAGRINTMGCLYAIKLQITDNVWIIGGIVIGILIPQAVFICMAKTLYDQVEMQKSKW
ncbi:tetraspanin-33-like [Babylonia areolata]|uniref:tetraspanin-33-like n=1 Tax=Babylonia areolata TaxID=304850 RepID=UPI003FD50181